MHTSGLPPVLDPELAWDHPRRERYTLVGGFHAPIGFLPKAPPTAAPHWTVYASNVVGVRIHRKRLTFEAANAMANAWRAAGYRNARPEVWPEGLQES